MPQANFFCLSFFSGISHPQQVDVHCQAKLYIIYTQCIPFRTCCVLNFDAPTYCASTPSGHGTQTADIWWLSFLGTATLLWLLIAISIIGCLCPSALTNSAEFHYIGSIMISACACCQNAMWAIWTSMSSVSQMQTLGRILIHSRQTPTAV